jgi:hypothetical protein
MTCCAMAGAVIKANAIAAPASLYLDIGFLLVKVPKETTPRVRRAFLAAPVTQA